MTRRGSTRKVIPQCEPTKAIVKSPKLQPLRTAQCSISPITSVHAMTSRDFQQDINAHIEVAAQQLKDYSSINYFQGAIMHNKHLFRGCTVLDIGCGVGILSLFAAKAGAARVYAVDSSNVLDYTVQIMRDNGYANVVHVIKGSVEQIELPVAYVDIIICNWLGYSMLFQSVCDAVIYARDKWLKKVGGIILPDVAKLFVAALEDGKHKNERIEWWNDVYGVNMKCLREFALSEPSIQLVQPHQLLSTQFGVKYLNMYTATRKDLKFRSKFMLEMRHSGHMDGIVTFFHVFFSKSHTPMGFSTDPLAPRTRWMQTVFFFDKPVHVNIGKRYYGGIELRSVGQECDLNNMELSFEMFSGDPPQLHLEAEMHWKLNHHAAITNNNSKGSKTENMSRQHLQQKESQRISIVTGGSRKESAKVLNVQLFARPAVSPSCSVVIGEHAYPCVVGKRCKKSKHTKKG